jgi:hypothetical protein
MEKYERKSVSMKRLFYTKAETASALLLSQRIKNKPYTIPWNRAPFEKLTVAYNVEKFLAFIEYECALPCSQELARQQPLP